MNIENKNQKTDETQDVVNPPQKNIRRRGLAGSSQQAPTPKRYAPIKSDFSGEALEKAKNYQSLNDLEKRIVSSIENAVNQMSKVGKNPVMGKKKEAEVFFISGFDYLGLSPERNNGILQMSKVVPNSKHYFWNDKDRIINDIKKLSVDAPVILVGHSLGGDTAVEVANAFNNVDNHFRKIDLIVTLDSVGLNNDIIPENVGKNLNYFGEKNGFFNDGPNAARDNSKTEVINNLRSEEHADLDNSDDIQREILDSIQIELKKAFKEGHA